MNYQFKDKEAELKRVRSSITFWRALNRLLMTIIIGAATCFGALTYVYKHNKARNAGAANASVEAQLAQLTAIQNNLKELSSFIATQKNTVESTSVALAKLAEEKRTLELATSADRKSVEALFQMQEERNQKGRSKEVYFSFALGVLSSLVAAVLWAVFTRPFSRQDS